MYILVCIKMQVFIIVFVFYVWPCATWAPRKNSASALNGYPRLKKNEINK